MGMGLLGAVAGLGKAGENVGEQMYKSADKLELAQHEVDYLVKKQAMIDQIKEDRATKKREAFVGEMDATRQAKIGDSASSFDNAADYYRTGEGMTDSERQTGLGAIEQARSRMGKLTPEEVGMAGLRTGNLEAKDYITATSRAESTSDKLANALMLKQLGIDATQQNIQTKETGKSERLDKSLASREGIAEDRIESNEKIAEKRVGQISGSQRVQNYEIDAARRVLAGMTPDEIKKKTAKFTNTGRDNPDYDATLATRVRLAAKRKYGDDDWFDSQNGLMDGESIVTQQSKGMDASARFGADPDMKSFKMGKQTNKGIEVLDANGKLIGHYR